MADTRPERRFTRIDRLPPYVFNITAELKMAARRRGEDIIDFSMGNPDGATPPHIVEKLCTVAQRPDTHGYSTSRGIPRLRRAISRWYQDRYDVEIDPESEAIVTIGSKEGLAHLMLATLDHGDTVLVPNPSYPIHIYGAVISYMFFAFLMCILNGLAIRKYLHYRQEVKRTFLIPGVASLIMALAVWLLYTPLENLMGNKPATLLCLVLAVLIYGFFVLFLRGITEEEMRAFPKGYLLVKVLKKIRLM